MTGEADMKVIRQQRLTGERALFGAKDLLIEDTIFDDGESPLKESSNLKILGSMFKWKYPLWYCRDVEVKNSSWFEMARAGVWYTDRISVTDCLIDAPKNFRRCRELVLDHVNFPHAEETLWNCRDVIMRHVFAKGDYFAMNCENILAENFELDGNYCFDGAKNVRIKNARLLSKDAFWNAENVTVTDSFICGEYLGWNSKNLTFENCTIESLQGMCYIENLVMKNCKLLNTTLAFEYSTVDADITTKIESVINPTAGTIRAESIGELILEKDRIDPEKTKIYVR